MLFLYLTAVSEANTQTRITAVFQIVIHAVFESLTRFHLISGEKYRQNPNRKYLVPLSGEVGYNQVMSNERRHFELKSACHLNSVECFRNLELIVLVLWPTTWTDDVFLGGAGK